MTQISGNSPLDLARIVRALSRTLGDNLQSCILHGSRVRGDLPAGEADCTLLIVLRESTPGAHDAIRRTLHDAPRVDPFVLGAQGLARSIHAFAATFLSISRDYTVLHGEDVLIDLRIDVAEERFLCEQGLRTARLRLVNSFVRLGDEGRLYGEAAVDRLADICAGLAEVLRLEGQEVPHDLDARLPLFEASFGVSCAALRELVDQKREPRRLSYRDVMRLHAGLDAILAAVIGFIETRWPAPGQAARPGRRE